MYSLTMNFRPGEWKLHGGFVFRPEAELCAKQLYSSGLTTKIEYQAYDPEYFYYVYVLVNPELQEEAYV